jgi:signal transduction histidine kinase
VLLTGADHDDTIQQTLLHLIQAVGVSRVFYLERVKTENVGLGLEMRYQVSADHIAAFPEHRSLFSDSIWGNWFAILWQGKPIIGQRETADPKAKELLREVGLVSVLLIPVGELDNWVGAIGFGETENKRVWDENEIQLLFTIAQMLFAYIERRRNALALGQARDEALRASQFKSELLAKISHELRTPLGAVLGYAQLLYFGSYGEMSAEQKGAAEVVISSTKYLNTLVNGILDQAQLESGQLVLTNRPFDLRQMAAEVETRIRVLAQSKGLVFEVNIGPGIPEWMMGDKMRLEQVLINLLGNAVKFTDSGKISMHFHIMGDNRLAIEVSDTGSGIPLDAQEQIFAPFVQVDGSPTRRHSGTGLGLSISKQLVTMMNGQIKLISEPGQGSTFTVELPIRAYVESVDEIGKDEKHHNH